MDLAVRPCKGAWNYCNGECETCPVNNAHYSNNSNKSEEIASNRTYQIKNNKYSVTGTEVVSFLEDIVCECGGTFYRADNTVLASYPPMYGYKCNNCGRTMTVSAMYPRIVHKTQKEIEDALEETRISNMPDPEYARSESGIHAYLVEYTLDTGVSHDKLNAVVFTNDPDEIKNTLSRLMAKRSDECIESIDRVIGLSICNNLAISLNGRNFIIGGSSNKRIKEG